MSDQLAQVIRAMRTATEIGNVVKAVEWGIQAIGREEDPLHQGRLIAEIDHILAQWNGRLTGMERDEVVRLTADVPQLQVIVHSRLKETPLSAPLAHEPESTPGVVRGLFVVKGNPSCGAVSTIQVMVLPGEKAQPRNVHFINPTGDSLISQAVNAAGFAVQGLLVQRGLTARGRGAYLISDIFIQIGEVTEIYEGTSIGLAVALGILSALCERPVPAGVSCTGAITVSGQIVPVGGIPAKVEVAVYKEMETVYLPAENCSEVDSDRIKLAKPVSHLAKVVDEVFGSDLLRDLVDGLNRSSLPAAQAMEQEEGRLVGKIPVLVSVIGNRDPYGDPQFQTKAMRQGSLLSAFGYVMPKAVCLLDNRLLKDQKSGERTEGELRAMDPSVVVRRVVLDITDPTDYDQLHGTMRSAVLAFLEAIPKALHCSRKDLVVNVNLSSGTAQMHAVWLELIRTRTFPTCRPLQVREPDHVGPGEGRVREVGSTHLRFGLASQG